MLEYWDSTDSKYEWLLEKELLEMINRGCFRSYGGLYDGRVEKIKLNADASSDVDIFGRDTTDKAGHWFFHLTFDKSGAITSIGDCKRNTE